MLRDSARLQAEDAKFFNKIHQSDGQTIEPLYDEDDARKCLSLFKTKDYGEEIALSDGVAARFLNAGHVLGSAMVQVDVQGPSGRRRILFTGDLGRRETILMNPPAAPRNVDDLLIESTYGDRTHDPISLVEKQLADVIQKTVASRGKLLIPSFALERSQEIIFIYEKLRRSGKIPELPFYVDSPMAVDITKIFEKNLDCFCFDPKFKEYAGREGDPFGFDSLHYVRGPEESKRLNDLPGPMVILSASGMCEGGRILHHLRNNVAKEYTTVLLVGYQAQGTLGRRLQDGAKRVKIFGLEHDVWCRVETLHTLSSHADREDLAWFVQSLDPRPRRVFLVHGDDGDRAALAQRLAADGVNGVEIPQWKDSFTLD
jgi:metallo-beta-lactamase family protein